MNPDFRLVPAAVVAWVVAALAIHLPVAGQAALAVAGLIAVVLAAGRGRVALVLAGAVAASVAFSTAVHSSGIVVCEGVATITGQAVRNGVETALGASSPARLAVRLTAVACGGGPARAASGVVVLLGEVNDVARDSYVTGRGRMLELPRGGDAYALLLDAEIQQVTAATGLVGAVAGRRADFLVLTSQLSPQGQGLVPGMTFGDDSALTDVLDQAMKRTSLSHLTAISGSHITMMLAVVLLLTVRASVRWRAVLLLAALGALLLLVGPEASVVRAAAMATVGAIALARGRPPQALPALATGITVIMIVDPWRSTSMGFALSVSASAALVLVVPRLARRVPEKYVWTRRAVAVTSVPLVAQLACAPIIVLFSPAISLASVLANVLVAPVVPLATGAGMLGLLTTQWEALSVRLVRLAEAATWWIAEVALTVSRLPGASIPWLGGIGGALILGMLSLVVLVALAGRVEPRGRHAAPVGPGNPRTRAVLHAAAGLRLPRASEVSNWARRFSLRGAIALACALVSIVAILGGMAWILRPPSWVVWQCDVGQGSATLIRSGPSSAVMIDVGEPEGRSQDCLARARITQLDLLVLTHPHADHVGNLPAVLASLPVREALVSPARTGIAERLDSEFAAVGLTPQVGLAGTSGQAGTAHWTVLWPRRAVAIGDDGAQGPEVNDASAVLLVESNGARIIALGDVEAAGQAGLFEQVWACGDACQAVDVVVVAHHGSRTQSTELARLLNPEIALVPVGENTYGHPAPETIALYESVGAVVLRTDLDGDVRVGNVGGP